LVDRLYVALRERRDSEFIRKEMKGQLEQVKKIKKVRKAVQPISSDPSLEVTPPVGGRPRQNSHKGLFGKKEGGKKKNSRKSSSKVKSEQDLVASISAKMDYQ